MFLIAFSGYIVFVLFEKVLAFIKKPLCYRHSFVLFTHCSSPSFKLPGVYIFTITVRFVKINQGELIMNYSNWLNKWVVNCVKPSSKYCTYIRYCEIINNHIVPNLGEHEVYERSLLDVQCFVTELMKNSNIKCGSCLLLI